jgi:hypothetical protein
LSTRQVEKIGCVPEAYCHRESDLIEQVVFWGQCEEKRGFSGFEVPLGQLVEKVFVLRLEIMLVRRETSDKN